MSAMAFLNPDTPSVTYAGRSPAPSDSATLTRPAGVEKLAKKIGEAGTLNTGFGALLHGGGGPSSSRPTTVCRRMRSATRNLKQGSSVKRTRPLRVERLRDDEDRVLRAYAGLDTACTRPKTRTRTRTSGLPVEKKI